MTLTEFLLARIAEDEAEQSAFHYECDTLQHGRHHSSCSEKLIAECEAKQRIVEAFEAASERMGSHPESVMATNFYGLRVAIQVLAEVYGDHPDYDEEWRS